MKNIYIIVRDMEESDTLQPVEALSSHRAFTLEYEAKNACASLIDSTGLGYYVLPLIVE